DGGAVFGNARVDHAGVGVLAEGAVHWAKTSGWGDGTNESSSRLPAIDPSRPAGAQPGFTRTRQYRRHTQWNRKTAARYRFHPYIPSNAEVSAGIYNDAP